MRRSATILAVVFSAAVPSSCDGLGFGPGFGSAARLSIVYLSPDGPLVDLCVGDEELFTDVGYEDATEYREVDTGALPVRVVPAGAGCGAIGAVSGDVDFPSGTDTTIVVLDFHDDLKLLVLDDDNSTPPEGTARIRLVHASPDTTVVDLTLSDGTLVFDDFAFTEAAEYLEVDAGTYDFDVRNAAGTTLLLPVDGVMLEDGGVYTFYLIGLLAGAPDLDVIITQDNF